MREMREFRERESEEREGEIDVGTKCV